MTELVQACPECDAASFTVNSTASPTGSAMTEARYRCSLCNATFAEPTERERRGHVTLRGDGTAAMLARIGKEAGGP